MLDFLMISTRSTKRGVIEIYPKFIIKKSSDLMIRGGDFYAIWIEEHGLWSTDEQDALQLIDNELNRYAEENRQKFESGIKVLHMWDAESGMIDSWHKYCQKQMRDSFHMLDEKLIFSNTATTKKDYASRKLSYPLEAETDKTYVYRFRISRYFQSKQYDKAAEMARKALEKKPDAPPSVVILAYNYIIEKQPEKAIEELKKALKLDPNYTEVAELLEALAD